MPIANQDRRGILNAFSTAPPASGAQLDGYPNGRRLGDDVTDIQVAALLGLPVDNLIPSAIQRPYALGVLGEADATAVANAFPQLPNLAALAAGADGVLRNDRQFSDMFPYQASPFSGNKVGRSRTARRLRPPPHPGGGRRPAASPAMASTPSTAVTPRRRVPRPVRWLLAAFALAAVVVVAGLFSLRARLATRAPSRAAAGVPPRAGGDALSAVTGSAKTLEELQARVAARPDDAEAPRCSASRTSSARARPTTRPSTPGPTPCSRRRCTRPRAVQRACSARARWRSRATTSAAPWPLASRPSPCRRAARRARSRSSATPRSSSAATPRPSRRSTAWPASARTSSRTPASPTPSSCRAAWSPRPISCARPCRPARAAPRTRSGRASSSATCWSARAASTRPRRSTARRSPRFRTTRGRRPASARWPSRTATSQPPSSRYQSAANHLPLPEIVIALGDVRAARGDAAGAADAYALVRAMETPLRAGRRQQRPRARALRRQPRAARRRPRRRRRPGPQGAGRAAVGRGPRRARLGAVQGRPVRRRAAGGPRGDGARHGRPADPVPPRRHRGLRRRRRPRRATR